MLNIIKNKKAAKKNIELLKNSISGSRVYLPKDISKFVFLCGANKNKDTISERRNALINFSNKHLPHTQFFLAEKIFSTLKDEGHKVNILDIEHEISNFADHILIVLESPSSFTELGAFSSKALRNKLIVINDSKFSTSPSFINLGPLKAIEESTSKNNIIQYKMKVDGIHKVDTIGDVFSPLFELLKEPLKPKASALKLELCNPANQFDKISAMFIHDLVFLTGPIAHKELVEILKLIFDEKDNFKLSEHLAILVAFNSIYRNKAGLYKSRIGRTYYDYRFDINSFISTFRNYILKHFPERIYGY